MSTRPAPFGEASREVPRRAFLGVSKAEYEAQKAEQKKAMESLANFKKFNPLIFSDEGSDPMNVESWVDSMEQLFGNLRMRERDPSSASSAISGQDGAPMV